LAELSAQLEAFLFDHVESFEELEVLLLVHQRRDTAWTAKQAAVELRIGADAAARAFQRLHDIRLVEQVGNSEPRYKYRPDPLQAERVDELANTYESDRLVVINTLSKQAIERIRVSAARTFADAFRLGGRKKKDG
jgi:hypothetical protein